ncbi:hypothetical protein ERO13_D09G138000v2 [Gossypium hirsutum]|uniref:Uncharacterized protein n=3 Tax=Gossypium TaxID=3633 RepID=A0A1U8JQA7_GOSHI|nr:uncharacterized protein LOC107908167 [Gossypium hirsutum]KAG4130353.1 hypothetical protein ERO13_D09G138000v2 [Gossypium hirsutum]PPD96086.1 hypothetical protein GOBAR_DD06873 [Gossypium barbadense]TYG54214.1 hypothetical protein ES288_D09G171400v1 [Gossypium darwinii]TYI65488.1 hypothetical protein E1A91_D09G161200v1 [Gossypium mustelinum]
MEEKNSSAVIRAVSHDEEGRKKVESTKVPSRKIDTIKYIERKLEDKGVQRLERHPADGIGIDQPPPKSGRGGKYTWEGPDGLAENELMAAPPAIDEKDPNYVDEEEEEKIVRDENSDVAELVVGEVEVAKAAEARKGVARVELDPHINLN